MTSALKNVLLLLEAGVFFQDDLGTVTNALPVQLEPLDFSHDNIEKNLKIAVDALKKHGFVVLQLPQESVEAAENAEVRVFAPLCFMYSTAS